MNTFLYLYYLFVDVSHQMKALVGHFFQVCPMLVEYISSPREEEEVMVPVCMNLLFHVCLSFSFLLRWIWFKTENVWISRE